MSAKNNTAVSTLQILTGPKKGKSLRLVSPRIVMGRSHKCDLIFKDDPSCSPEHVLFYKEGSSYIVKSLDFNKLVLVNNKPIRSHLLQSKDEIQIGRLKLRFFQKKKLSPLPSRLEKPERKKKKAVFFKFVLILVFLGTGFLFLSDNSSEKETEKIKLKTKKDTLSEVEDLNQKIDLESKKFNLNFKQKGARIAFISGFRDYRKGYYKRALNMFKHCLILDKKNPLCRSYELKSFSQIEKLVQKKMETGNSYLEKKQYSACEAAFRSVEIMVEDTNHPVYKEARAKKTACLINLKNRI